jgi:hypothetical protein
MSSTPTPLQSPMPDLLDVAVMVRQYEDLSEEERAKLAELLMEPFALMLRRGRVVIGYIANTQSASRPADIALDRGWGGLDGGVEAVVKLYSDGSTPLTEQERAQRERAVLLRERWVGGLSFLKLSYMEQWRESEQRLEVLDKPMGEGAETPRQALAALGLSWALERLGQLHDTYGRALGIHGLIDVSAEEVRGWEVALDAFLSGLRFFHAQDAAVWSVFSGPYVDALRRGKERRRKAAAKAKAGDDKAADDDGATQ